MYFTLKYCRILSRLLYQTKFKLTLPFKPLKFVTAFEKFIIPKRIVFVVFCSLEYSKYWNVVTGSNRRYKAALETSYCFQFHAVLGKKLTKNNWLPPGTPILDPPLILKALLTTNFTWSL